MQEQASNNDARCFKDPSLSNHLIFLPFAAAAARFLGDKLVLGRRFSPGFLVEAKKTYELNTEKKGRLISDSYGQMSNCVIFLFYTAAGVTM